MIRCGNWRSGADISADGVYRYHLWRAWGRGDHAVFVMLNPSTADHETDDMTIRKCCGFARRWDCGGIEVINLYALRATDPMILRDVEDPEGPGNPSTWAAILRYFHRGPIVAAWGGSFPRALAPSRALCRSDTSSWQCLGRTTEGHPRHPSRLAYDTELVALHREAVPA